MTSPTDHPSSTPPSSAPEPIRCAKCGRECEPVDDSDTPVTHCVDCSPGTPAPAETPDLTLRCGHCGFAPNHPAAQLGEICVKCGIDGYRLRAPTGIAADPDAKIRDFNQDGGMLIRESPSIAATPDASSKDTAARLLNIAEEIDLNEPWPEWRADRDYLRTLAAVSVSPAHPEDTKHG